MQVIRKPFKPRHSSHVIQKVKGPQKKYPFPLDLRNGLFELQDKVKGWSISIAGDKTDNYLALHYELKGLDTGALFPIMRTRILTSYFIGIYVFLSLIERDENGLNYDNGHNYVLQVPIPWFKSELFVSSAVAYGAFMATPTELLSGAVIIAEIFVEACNYVVKTL